MSIRHPPGRAGRLWLFQRLETARRAADLLEHKERVLLREQRRLVTLERRTSAAWEEACREAETWGARVAVLRGRRASALVPAAGWADVHLVWRNAMGAYYPAEAQCGLPAERPVAALTGTAAMVQSVAAYRHALERAVEHAATRRATAEVDREIVATRRRLRMLERHWIPRLEASLHEVDHELEERERADVVHARWADTRRWVAR